MAKKAAVKQMQRLDKIVAHITGWSRQQATKVIRDGGVVVGEEVILDGATKVSISAPLVIAGFNDLIADDDDALWLDQEAAAADESTLGAVSAQEALAAQVFLLNKPANYVCADRDKNHNVVTTLLRSERNHANLHCAGRLDLDTTGLLVVTDDGALIHNITAPRKEVNKVYLARLDRALPKHAVRRFAEGIKHPEEDKRYQGAKLTPLTALFHELEAGAEPESGHWAAVQLSQGRFHQVKRMFEMVGCEVQELTRVAIGALNVTKCPVGTKLGAYYRLSPAEVELLFTNQDYELAELEAMWRCYLEARASAEACYLAPVVLAARQAAVATAAAASAGTEQDDDELAGDAAQAAGESAQEDMSADEFDSDEFDSDDLSADSAEDFSNKDDAAFEAEQGDFDEFDADGNFRIY
ncbi:MAG TPA: pseudouridine synthase [Candidatus Anaerobiospirillum stercoravium]|nr:pseudouridine synthase [Candidatus Anaerobiospirillum stercoravium]